ncbi:MAG: putative HTH-type transcriptional regulator YjiR [Deltaproteobacteria bacterium ADurb.Bin510]|nr:MAG: putative HTH-type transcriptional regulator YjiR [Deltaproteobacteria bacterium ADurb.Bin510]
MAGRQLNACLREALSCTPELMVRYANVAGDMQLRIQLAAHMLTKGVSVSPDEIIVTNGATEAAYAILRALTRPGDLVAVESPAYYGLINLFETLGLYALEIPTHASEGIELAALERALERYEVRACVLQPNFGNPLGGLYPEAKRRAVLDLLTAKGVPLIEDDVYGDLSHSGSCPASIKAFDHSGQAVYISSFSKTLAPGLRIGWIIPGRYHDAVLRQRIAATLSNATAAQAAVAAYLTSGRYGRHVRRLGETMKDQVSAYRQQISASFPAGTRVTDPHGGFLLWVELPEAIDTMELYRACLKEGVAFAPGPLFTSQDRFASHLRISCGYPLDERFKSALETIGRLAASQAAGA